MLLLNTELYYYEFGSPLVVTMWFIQSAFINCRNIVETENMIIDGTSRISTVLNSDRRRMVLRSIQAVIDKYFIIFFAQCLVFAIIIWAINLKWCPVHVKNNFIFFIMLQIEIKVDVNYNKFTYIIKVKFYELILFEGAISLEKRYFVDVFVNIMIFVMYILPWLWQHSYFSYFVSINLCFTIILLLTNFFFPAACSILYSDCLFLYNYFSI